MPKTKSSEKKHYEILYIVSNKFTEEETKGIDESVKKIVTDHEGEITYSENWGKKKFAYPIKGFNHGYYLLFEFDLWGKDLAEVDHLLRMSSRVLRHQIIAKRKRSEEEIKKEKEKSAELAKKDEPEEIIVKKKEEKKKTETVDKKGKETKKEEKKKTDLKDLDKKLDDILSADDLL